MTTSGARVPRAPAARARKERVPAADLPVARVCVDTPLPHLDRPFDYLVPEDLSKTAQPGVRVKVRFAGQALDGFLLERVAESAHPGKLAFLEKVVSPERVLTAEVARAARAVADRYAGTLSDVLRLAVPPRHGRAEKAARVAAGLPGAGEAAATAVAASPTADGPSPSPMADAPSPSSTSDASSPSAVADAPSSPRTADASFPSQTATTLSPSPTRAPAPVATPLTSSPINAEISGEADGDVVATPPSGVGMVAAAGGGVPTRVVTAGWAPYPAGEAFIRALADGKAPRAVWSALPGEDWPARLAEAAAATAASGRGTVIVVADQRDLDRVDAALSVALSAAPAWGAAITRPVQRDLDHGDAATAADRSVGDLDRVDAAAPADRSGHDHQPVGDEQPAGSDRSAEGERPVDGDSDAPPEHSDPGTPAGYIALSAALGPEARYRRFLQAARGEIRVVAGTRAAALAPVAALGLVVIWDDGDDVHADPHAPYPHAREVLLTRAHLAGAAALVGGFARTAEAQQLVETGWARDLAADRDAVRVRAPQVLTVGEEQMQTNPARLPSVAWKAAQAALAAGHPVLVQVPRRGYLPSIACLTCRQPARCPHCRGPLALDAATGPATCRWCARIAAGWQCAECGSRALRASVVGARRTAEELGRAFAGVPVRTSGREGVLASVPAGPALVISTPGAEPYVERGGYGAVLLLDTWALLTRADLRAGEETLRRWMAAAALALPAARGGTVVVVADGGLAAVQALLRFDPGWLAARDLAERRELGFPPAARMASLTGPPAAVDELLAAARLPDGAEVLGPVPSGDEERFLVRVPRGAARTLADALRDAAGVRSLRKSLDMVRIRMDPIEIL